MAQTLLPPDVQIAVEAALSVRIARATPLSGGMVNRAVRAETESGAAIFLKWKTEAPPGLFDAEADGLRRLAETGTLRVPGVLAFGDDPAFLALEWIPGTQPRDENAFSRRFAEGLAALHRVTEPDGLFGLDRDNYLGSQPQSNTKRTTDWATFYRDSRLAPQIERARRLSLVPAERERLFDTVIERLPELLDGMPPEASLIHGDLWSGNFLCVSGGGDEPVLIDPAVYFAPREMEMAYVELFGGFPPQFVAHYHRTLPLDAGYPRRRPLHQLYPLLIHLNHFGERQYGAWVDRNCRACLMV